MISYLSRSIDDPVVLSMFIQLTNPVSRFRFLEITFGKEKPAAYLRTMEYKLFLHTVYWNVLREYLLQEAGTKCEICQSDYDLRIHHLSYTHHGSEHLFLKDLQVLCGFCHGWMHSDEKNIKPLLRALAFAKNPWFDHRPQKYIENLNYDPRTLLNLHDYGDIRGRTNE